MKRSTTSGSRLRRADQAQPSRKIRRSAMCSRFGRKAGGSGDGRCLLVTQHHLPNAVFCPYQIVCFDLLEAGSDSFDFP